MDHRLISLTCCVALATAAILPASGSAQDVIVIMPQSVPAPPAYQQPAPPVSPQAAPQLGQPPCVRSPIGPPQYLAPPYTLQAGPQCAPAPQAAPMGYPTRLDPGLARLPEPTAEPTRANRALAIPGGILFGVSWLLHGALVSQFAGGGSSDWESFRWTGLVPILGPWIQMALLPTPLGSDMWAGYLAIDGILQLGGLAMLIGGLLHQRPARRRRAAAPELQLLPMAGNGSGGLTAVGSF